MTEPGLNLLKQNPTYLSVLCLSVLYLSDYLSIQPSRMETENIMLTTYRLQLVKCEVVLARCWRGLPYNLHVNFFKGYFNWYILSLLHELQKHFHTFM